MLRFTKMSGAGNDFVMIDNRAGDIHLNSEQIARICDRHRGIGADGILLLEEARNGADFRMRYFNSDGGEAEMCGNGARCFARFAHKVAGAPGKISFETPAGVIGAELHDELVTLQMSKPTDLRLNIALRLARKTKTVHFINTGVPHVVVPVSQIDDVDVRRAGEAIRYPSVPMNVVWKTKRSRAAREWSRARSFLPQSKMPAGQSVSSCAAVASSVSISKKMAIGFTMSPSPARLSLFLKARSSCNRGASFQLAICKLRKLESCATN